MHSTGIYKQIRRYSPDPFSLFTRQEGLACETINSGMFVLIIYYVSLTKVSAEDHLVRASSNEILSRCLSYNRYYGKSELDMQKWMCSPFCAGSVSEEPSISWL